MPVVIPPPTFDVLVFVVILAMVSVLCSVKHFTFDLWIHCRFVCVNRLSVTTGMQTGTKMCEGGIAVGLM